MSRLSRFGRQRSWSPRRKALGVLTSRGQRKRKPFSFERLEDRYYFSVTPGLDYQIVSLSSDTLDGAAAIRARESAWIGLQAAPATIPQASQYTFLALPSDPLFTSQWHLLNVGQEVGNPDFQNLYGVAGEDINVVPAWNTGYTGAGVTVAVMDSGVQLTHPDLIANLHPTLRYNSITGTNNPSPNLQDPAAGHGTAVAGLIGASANNGLGGTGVAPGVTLVPVLLGFADQQILGSFQFALQSGVDITNNSWGPDHSTNRSATPLTLAQADTLRDSVIFGRDGLGMIHVFASGNDAGPFFSPGFQSFGNYDSASYNPWVNSRYTIGVTGVDHDGQYGNADGTFTSYPNAGASVLVAAPTGSNLAQNVADDSGQGSGIWTTDLVGQFGFNAAPIGGVDFDRDFLPDPDYTSRFNGTSAAAPIVSGVIALMLEANPNLTYRDVQEILVRSARQNAEFETPTSGSLQAARNTWQTNQIGPFRDPDPWNDPTLYPLPILEDPFQAIFNPLADPNLEAFFGGNFLATDGNDGGRQFGSHYEPEPPLFTNGAGYTVSQGYGVYSEQMGYAHGVVDAALAVKMAEQWHTLDQNIDRLTEKTFSTFVVNFGTAGLNLPAAEKMAEPPDGPAMLVPGGIGGLGGFIDYWDEFNEEVDFDDMGVPDPESGPFSGDNPPVNTRGFSYLDFRVPPTEAVNVEWVEVKIDIEGPAEDLDFLRIMLASPDGTHSELNHYWADLGFSTPISFQPISVPGETGDSIWRIDPAGDIDVDGGPTFTWTFSTNRSWGESTNTTAVIDPVTGEPALANGLPIFRDWELHIENWSTSDFALRGLEVVWHGKPIEGGATDPNWGVANAQRVQGFVGIDANADGDFNFSRTIQTVFDTDADPLTVRLQDVTRQLDFNDANFNGIYDEGDTINQESFAENVLVEAFRVVNGTPEASPTARFLTGADGNYYFDLDPTFEYEIRISDPEGREVLEDTITPSMAPAGMDYLAHYKQVWRITPDWFYAADRDNPPLAGNEPGEILFGTVDANGDGVSTDAPLPYLDALVPVPMAVKNINFLVRQDAPPNEIVVNGTVIADLNGDGLFNEDDTPVGGVSVYWDANRNGGHDAGELTVVSSDDPLTRGQYSITIPATAMSTYAVGIIPPSADWDPTNPSDGTSDLFAAPGDVLDNFNFFIDPPDSAFPPAGSNLPGNIAGTVFNDLNVNGARNPGEVGLPGFRVFVDSNENGVFNVGEAFTFTSSNGSFFLSEIPPGLIRIDIEIANEGTENASWRLTTPAAGFRQVTLGPGGVVSGQLFGLENRANSDWGDLPNSYGTLAGSNGPRHVIVPGFQLGSRNDGEVNGIPSTNANGDDLIGNDDDGIVILSNAGILQTGPNLLQITVQGVGGLLNAWMDFNGNGQFDASEQVFTNLDINPGTHQRTVSLPLNTVPGQIAARFRWGEPGLSWLGPAGIGEVEDYVFPSSVSAVVPLVGDFNDDGAVNDLDRGVWYATFGSTVDLRADGNNNGVVDAADFVLWRKNRDAEGAGGSSVASGTSTNSATNHSSPEASPQQSVGLDFLSGGVAGNGVGGSSSSSSQTAPTIAPQVPSALVDAVGSVIAATDSRSISESRQFIASLGVLASSDASENSRFVVGSSVAAAESDDSLLLVDEAWADFNASGDDDADDSQVAPIRNDDDEIVSDLALAAALEDESNWWSI